MTFYSVIRPGTWAQYAKAAQEEEGTYYKDSLASKFEGHHSVAFIHGCFTSRSMALNAALNAIEEYNSFLSYDRAPFEGSIEDLIVEGLTSRVRWAIYELHDRPSADTLPIKNASWAKDHWFVDACNKDCPEVDLSVKGNVLIYANAHDMLRLKRTSMKAGRWIKMRSNGALTKIEIEWASRAFTLNEALLPPGYETLRYGFAEGEQAAIDVYAGGVYSCMQNDKEVAQWGTGDFRVAYVYDTEDKLLARAVVSLKSKTWMSIYGHDTMERSLLEAWLIGQGFQQVSRGGWDGSRCRLVSWLGHYLTPYIDRGDVWYDHDTGECVFDPYYKDTDQLHRNYPRMYDALYTVPDLRPEHTVEIPAYLKTWMDRASRAEQAEEAALATVDEWSSRYYQQNSELVNLRNRGATTQNDVEHAFEWCLNQANQVNGYDQYRRFVRELENQLRELRSMNGRTRSMSVYDYETLATGHYRPEYGASIVEDFYRHFGNVTVGRTASPQATNQVTTPADSGVNLGDMLRAAINAPPTTRRNRGRTGAIAYIGDVA
ncbi:hypothetical protein HOS13_gp08 [Caulobacter phage Lullwater]|uniref:Uncharacterized protein n=1 Tax=Caulobacter phage Lullwater TaxID=2024607 RepID=A0A291LB93_9CAUD|nr:hypothetical protein HOS13_gp08 [Caulobacter phage Lullwater]ATI16315.1 hypothetical protein Lull_008 [Caulobacter phage Lullwater]